MYLLIAPIQLVFHVMNIICKHVSNTYIQISIHESEIATMISTQACQIRFSSFHFALDMLISMPCVAQKPEKV